MLRLTPAFGLAALSLILVGCGQPARTRGAAARPEPAQPPAQVQVAQEGKPAPDFSFTTLEGTAVRLSDLKGKPVVLNFWASWCHYCVAEAPDLEALYQKYRPQGLQMVGVGTDDESALRQKAKELKLTYAIGANAGAATAYGVNGIPHTFMINREGSIVASLVGARPRAELEAEIKKIL